METNVQVTDHAPGFHGAGDDTRSELRARLLADFGGAILTPGVCDELLDFLAESGALAGRRPAPGSEEARWSALCSKLLAICQYIKERPTPVAIYAALHAWGIPDFDDINRHLNQQQFADSIVVRTIGGKPIYLTKAAVNNAVLAAQAHFRLPPRADQRDEDSRQTMSNQRLSQLQPN